jgi:hypothetical protein
MPPIITAVLKMATALPIPFILEVVGLLAAFIRPSHIAYYAPGASFSCRLPTSSMILGIYLLFLVILQTSFHFMFRTQDHRHPLVNIGGLNVHNPLVTC